VQTEFYRFPEYEMIQRWRWNTATH